jgi:hypothetical protein
MLRAFLLGLAAVIASAAIVSCQSDEAERIRAAQLATCRDKASPPENPTYDEECMRRVEDQVRAARTYRPSTKPPKKK